MYIVYGIPKLFIVFFSRTQPRRATPEKAAAASKNAARATATKKTLDSQFSLRDVIYACKRRNYKEVCYIYIYFFTFLDYSLLLVAIAQNIIDLCE